MYKAPIPIFCLVISVIAIEVYISTSQRFNDLPEQTVEARLRLFSHTVPECSFDRRWLSPLEKSHRDNSRVHLDWNQSRSMLHYWERKYRCNNLTSVPLKQNESQMQWYVIQQNDVLNHKCIICLICPIYMFFYVLSFVL